jgi:DNA polymerase III subunit alpha
MSYMCGYFRYYYPVEYCTSYLNCAKNNDDIVNGTALIKKYGITIKPVRFGYSVWEYMCDSKNKTIYKGLDGIKYLNSTIAEELCNLRDGKYDTFVDVLNAIKNTTVNSRQLDVLIKVDFFSEFGEMNKLLDTAKKFQMLSDKKVILKKKIEDLQISEEMLRRFAAKETDAQFRFTEDGILSLIKMHEKVTKVKPISVGERLKYQQEFLGYVDFVDKNLDVKYIFISDLDTKYSPRAKVYCLKTGETCDMKFYKKLPRSFEVKTSFEQIPVENGDVLYMTKCKKRPKKRMNKKGRWVNTDEFEWWIIDYRKVEDLENAV